MSKLIPTSSNRPFYGNLTPAVAPSVGLRRPLGELRSQRLHDGGAPDEGLVHDVPLLHSGAGRVGLAARPCRHWCERTRLGVPQSPCRDRMWGQGRKFPAMMPKFDCRIPKTNTNFVHSTVAVRIVRKEILCGTDSHGTTTLGSYLPQAIRAGPRREFQSPIRGRGLRRATSVQTPIAVRAKLASGRHAPLRRRPLCPRQTACTRFRERMQPRVVPCASARRRRRGGNLHGTRRYQLDVKPNLMGATRVAKSSKFLFISMIGKQWSPDSSPTRASRRFTDTLGNSPLLCERLFVQIDSGMVSPSPRQRPPCPDSSETP